MKSSMVKEKIEQGKLLPRFIEIYGKNSKNRYLDAIMQFEGIFGNDRDISIFSSPGRTELIGNHTDHQHGKAIAAAINIDIIAVVARSNSNVIRVKSRGHDLCVVAIDDLAKREKEVENSCALVRGVAAKFVAESHALAGFDAYSISNVPTGSGLSSSAAFEVLLAQIMNELFCDSQIIPIDIAKFSQFAENKYYGKPCGLLDQTACAVGGVVAMDFKNFANPQIEKCDFSLEKYGLSLIVVNTGANHSDLTDEYAKITTEMSEIARLFSKEYLRDVEKQEFFENIGGVYAEAPDRAILRAIHFFSENERVDKLLTAINSDDIVTYLSTINSSGQSSFDFLQNVYCDSKCQSLSIALAVTKEFLNNENSGACRVHGGGFAGTIQSYIPTKSLESYVKLMEKLFGEGCCTVLSFRKDGVIKFI